MLFSLNDPPTTDIYTLSLHDALPISHPVEPARRGRGVAGRSRVRGYLFDTGSGLIGNPDRKSTRLNSSHPSISYAVFCLKKKKRNPLHLYAPNHCTVRVEAIQSRYA